MKPLYVAAPISKSYLHRYIIASALSGDLCSLNSLAEDALPSDIRATKNGIIELLSGKKSIVVDCGESGSTLRFLMPLAAVLGIKTEFVLHGRLASRPNKELESQLTENGCNITRPKENIIRIKGSLTGNQFNFDNPSSSQFISGLLMSLPLSKASISIITVNGELQSAPYVQMTIDILKKFSVNILENKSRNQYFINIPGNQEYCLPIKNNIHGHKNSDLNFGIEADWSNAAFLIAIGALGNKPLVIRGLSLNTAQGDKKIYEIMRQFGVLITINASDNGDNFIDLTVYPSKDNLKSINEIDISQNPDLAPIVALIACLAYGKTKITKIQRLRLKESDRIESITRSLKSLGADITVKEDEMVIHGKTELTGTYCGDCYGDHRIIMMVAAASLITKQKVYIRNYLSVTKSYPHFFDELKKLGYLNNIELLS